MIDTTTLTQATIDAALAGDGVALEWLRICAPDLAEGLERMGIVREQRKKTTHMLNVAIVAELRDCAAAFGVTPSRLVEFSLVYVLSRVASGDLALPMVALGKTIDVQAARKPKGNEKETAPLFGVA